MMTKLSKLQRALRALAAGPSRTASSQDLQSRRVAKRWIQANISREYDVLLRLQVLEGVAGVPHRTWFMQGRRGLDLAAKHFEPEQARTLDDWLKPEDQKGYADLLKVLSRHIQKRDLSLDVQDVINSGLYGTPLNNPSRPTLSAQLYKMGKALKKQILSGRASSRSILSGPGARGFKQIIDTEG
jgi:hypothetical protein